MYRLMLKNGEFSSLKTERKSIKIDQPKPTENPQLLTCPFKFPVAMKEKEPSPKEVSPSKASNSISEIKKETTSSIQNGQNSKVHSNAMSSSEISKNQSSSTNANEGQSAAIVSRGDTEVRDSMDSIDDADKAKKYHQAKEMITAILGQIKGENDKTAQKHFEQTNRLSDRQREIIQKTFVNIEKDPVRNGLKIFIKLLSEHPTYKKIWPQFRAIPDSSLMNAVELRKHASVYMCGLRSIIDSMQSENELAEQLNRIAKAHIKWNVQRKHVFNMLDPVLDMVKEMNGNQLDAETKEAWSVLYEVISNLIEVYRHKDR